MHNRAVKKEIMFIAREDYYYYTYGVLLALDGLGCKGKRWLYDSRKLPHIVSIICRKNVYNVVSKCKQGLNLNSVERQQLSSSYLESTMTALDINKVLFSLEQNEIIEIRRGSGVVWDCQMKPTRSLLSFVHDSIFKDESERMLALKTVIPRMSSLKYETFLDRIYNDCGVKAWVS